MTGKNKCKILKEIRRQIAADNDINLVVEECKYQGDCKGTCPRCEAELAYLEKELANRKKLGKAIAITATAALLAGYAAGEAQVVENVILDPIHNTLQSIFDSINSDNTQGVMAP